MKVFSVATGAVAVAAALAGSLSACGSSSPTTAAPRAAVSSAPKSAAPAESAEATASRIEQAVSAAVPESGGWTLSRFSNGSPVVTIDGAYQVFSYGTQGNVEVDLYHNTDLAQKAASHSSAEGWLNAYVDGSVVVCVAPQATNAEVSAVQANH